MREAIKLKGETGIWEMVIGLEIHAQVNCKSKLFSGSAEPENNFDLQFT